MDASNTFRPFVLTNPKRATMKIIDIISKILVIAAFFLVCYMIILKLTNHSPTLSQFNTTMIFLLMGFSIRTQYKLGKFDEFMEQSKEDMSEVKGNIKEITKDLHKLDKKVGEVLLKLA